ncbi:hypothetical protein MRB53_001906 [Persea americana]|uniref:Uncharacterized protein n=1 Tax=Persea americana TaxID=3435 RepID=A0ACC2MTZ1_PERAE|nr:hypothetical protein MRB53_001906 [Persea americana]
MPLVRGTFGSKLSRGDNWFCELNIPVGKRCGFVQFANRACAEEALLMLNGTQLGGQAIRLSWSRSPSNKQPQPDPNQWNGRYYGYGQELSATAVMDLLLWGLLGRCRETNEMVCR